MKAIIMIILAVLFLASIASAYSYDSPANYYPRSPYYRYNEQQNFFANADIARNTLDTNSIDLRFLQDNTNQASRFSNSNQQVGAQGYFNNLFSNTETNRDLSLNDGYSIAKKPVSTREIKVWRTGHGYKIRETINDGISGTFFKNNAYNDNAKNDYGANQNNFGAQAYNTNSFNEGSYKRNAIDLTANYNAQASTFKTLKASIGKGDLIIFN